MTSARNPVGISSQDARIEFAEDDTPEDLARKVNDALVLVRDDIQRLAGLVTKSVTDTISTNGLQIPMTMAGTASLWAISNTATAGSTGAAYHTLTLTRNGIVVGTQTYDTRRAEILAYKGGNYVGQVQVGVGDILAATLAVTGAPAPTLTTANFCLLCTVRGS